MKCDDIRRRLPVSVLVQGNWIAGHVGNYDLRHTYGREDWTGHVCVRFESEQNDPVDGSRVDDADTITVKVPVAMVATHLRERTA